MSSSTQHSTPSTRRHQALERLAATPFDLLVVGGGITGCGIARDAAMRGLRTALVEKDDFASGTSSRSSRLVHGGVRYLEHGHLHLVFEASRERRTLLRVAPHLVRPLRFTWPVYEGARVPGWKLRAGLALYDALSFFRNVAPHRRLDAEAVGNEEPALRRDGLVGGATYYDAATDDARLTLANAVAAAEAGAVVLNHARASAVAPDPLGAGHATVVDALTGREARVAARVIVNAAGPWSDEVRRLSGADDGRVVRGTKGVHVTVPRERVGNRGALTLLSPLDGRVMFVLPAGAQTIIGTTDTPTDESPDDVRADRGDVEYLVRSAAGFFPDAGIDPADVISAWAGIRPLAAAAYADDAGSASREHAVTDGPPGLLSVTGGKLTTYRSMAAEVVDAVQTALDQRRQRAATHREPLPGGDVGAIEPAVADAAAAVGDAPIGERLVAAHGSRWRDVWALAARSPALAAPIADGLPYVLAEAVYAVEREMAATLGDVLIRRTHVAFETPDHGLAAAGQVARVLGWDRTDAVREYAAEVERVFGARGG